MMHIRPCPPKSLGELTREWDELAEERHRQIASGEDLSFEHIVVPTTWSLFEGADRTVVLDIGSGTVSASSCSEACARAACILRKN